ncbi:LLM class flavin-dependent oxidoreductase [Gordonia terrae]|uniref:LLM class flavin-dependent oxidoreductase n=1 Tax=Gordonia terrae TaxID=2055 RepID=A0A2I1R5Z7_9ACTN|nr:LLM class flavin-dependent oxidoreductase [Gordonia terrae]PKZ64554.1 LLM class flavin-dependent oxidoreductase [Gordonia terrae]UPW10094.1 LLM class flavin-dependent oxidoreductase [Gordonia terrae]
MEFGAFLAPWHKVGTDANTAIHQDLQLVEHMDRLGFAEFWIGEHHSGGVEIVASPEMFLAAAAQRTARIKLGLGVVSLPYHNPFMIADRVVLLDHLSRGRAIFGAGPGQLADDAHMIGIDPVQNRRKMEEAFDVIHRLLAGETVTEQTDWYTLKDAYLHLAPYSKIQKAVTATVSPTGPKLAGKYGAGILSLAATNPVGVELLAEHWGIAEQLASESGQEVSRDQWRLTGLMHVAETEQQARDDCRHGLLELMNYLSHVTPGFEQAPDVDTLIDAVNESGLAVIGTPEMAIAQVERLQEKSGGFGKFLVLHGEWAPQPAALRSFELIAERVFPAFSGSHSSRRRGFDQVVNSNRAGAEATAAGQEEARKRYESERSVSVS